VDRFKAIKIFFVWYEKRVCVVRERECQKKRASVIESLVEMLL
jgi:hypothetical protein